MKKGLGMLLVLMMAGSAYAAPKGLYGLPPLTRDDFNRLALAAQIPLFWNEDSTNPGVVDPEEVVVLGVGSDREKWVGSKGFTNVFEKAYRKLAEMKRQEAVQAELDQGRPTLVRTDLTKATHQEKELVNLLVTAAKKIDELYIMQRGAGHLRDGIATTDLGSQALFFRNSGPWCESAAMELEPFCNATPDFCERRWGGYPMEESQDATLCEHLKTLPNARELMDPFTVVRKVKGKYEARSYLEEYGPQMRAIAKDLRFAAKVALSMKEKALEEYLLAAAKGFETNNWDDADVAWTKMNSTNSLWYLRVAPDEVYWDLCQEKAGFHMSFARIDRSALSLQEKLTKIRDEMEQSLAQLAAPAYQARNVSFQMPDFIEIVVNAGDARSAMGATIGQSLPNWGPVAQAGGGRTVVMTNLYMDPDSKRLSREKAGLLLTPKTMEHYTEDPMPGLIDIILHEATHNLGPHSDYIIDGKTPSEVFGGQTASVLEELKAQTGALYYVPLLRKHGILTEETAKNLYVHAMAWCFGHISQGMFTAAGNPKAYSQLAAVHIGTLMEAKALTWEVAPDPVTGKLTGRFEAHFDKFEPAMNELMKKVVEIKATGDVAAAKEILGRFVTGEQKELVHADEIAERLAAFPKASMVYAVEF